MCSITATIPQIGLIAPIRKYKLNELEENWAKEVIQKLNKWGTIREILQDEWFCNVCSDWHPFTELKDALLYKVCPDNIISGLNGPVALNERSVYIIDWGKLWAKVRKINKLSDSDKPLEAIGVKQHQIVVASFHTNTTSFTPYAKALHQDYPQQAIVFIVQDSLLLSTTDTDILSSWGCLAVTLSSLVQANGKLPKVHLVVTNEIERARKTTALIKPKGRQKTLILGKSRRCLISVKKIIELTSAEFKSICVFFDYGKSAFSEDDFFDALGD